MRCRDLRGKLEAHLAGHLDPVAAQCIERHIAACPRCAAEAARARELWSLLGAQALPPVSEGFSGRVRAAVARERSVARGWRLLPSPIAAAAVAVVVAAGLGIAAGRGLASGPPTRAASAPIIEPEASDYVGAGSGSTFVSLYTGFAEGAPR